MFLGIYDEQFSIKHDYKVTEKVTGNNETTRVLYIYNTSGNIKYMWLNNCFNHNKLA